MQNVKLAQSMGLPTGDLFHVLTSAVPGFVWVCKDDGRIIFANEPWSEYCGLSPEQWHGFGWLKAIHPDDIPVLEEAWKAALHSGVESYEVQTRCRHHSGTHRWHKIVMRRSPVSGEFWIGCGVDIHDMVQASRKDVRQLRMLEAVASGANLDTILDMLCEYAEFRLPGTRCAILLVDEASGTFAGGISHSLPDCFTEGLRGEKYGPGIGSCGTAAFAKEDVIVSSIATHPYWDGFRDIVLPYGVKACWSRPILGSDGKVLATFGFYFDEECSPTPEEMSRMDGITHIATMSIERIGMLKALRESEEHYRHTVELNPQIPWIANSRGRIVSVSTKWAVETGMSQDESLGDGWVAALHPDDTQATLKHWVASLKNGKPLDVEYRLRLKDGDYRWIRARAFPRRDETGSIVRWYGTLEDVHHHRLAQDRLQRAAYEDELTKVGNRRRFENELNRAMTARTDTDTVGLIMMDLNDFKQVNDRFGHAAGDAVLRLFAHHLRRQLREGEMAARLGGDEFAVILPDIAGEDELLQRASAITGAIDRQLRKSAKARNCTASAGCAIAVPNDTSEDLLRKADLALYEAKAACRGAKLFTPSIRDEHERKADEIELARKAQHAGWILPHYQPKVSLADGGMVGLEALIRIDHPEKGLLSPSSIMSALDHPRLGGKIGQRLISKVIADMARLRAQGVALGHVAVNLSSENVNDNSFPDWLMKQLAKANLPPEMMKLEITERVLLDELAQTAACALGQLRKKGMLVSLDDFGTGYASLTHLQRFPVDEIKIDQSFIRGLAVDSSNATIVKAMINLGHNLGMDVVAEGVETPTQALLLRSWGCNIAQGFLYARPMPVDDIAEFAAGLKLADVGSKYQPLPLVARSR